MAIGRHEPRSARNTDFRCAIAIGVDEALTALEESFQDLSDNEMRAFPVEGRGNIAWIIMHVLQNLDVYIRESESGEETFPHDWKWNLWGCSEEEAPGPEDAFPEKAGMLGWLRSLRRNGEKILKEADEDFLISRPGGEWAGNRADMYMRTIFHTMAHVRQIWLLRGALGLTEGRSWPQQHWA